MYALIIDVVPLVEVEEGMKPAVSNDCRFPPYYVSLEIPGEKANGHIPTHVLERNVCSFPAPVPSFPELSFHQLFCADSPLSKSQGENTADYCRGA